MDKEQAKKDAFEKFKVLIDIYKQQEQQFEDNKMFDLVITMRAHRNMVELKLKTFKMIFK